MADLKRPTTSADRTKLMIGASFAAFHCADPDAPRHRCRQPCRPVTSESKVEWLESFHPSSPHRTPGFGSRHAACTDDACCKPQIANSSLGSYSRLLKYAPQGEKYVHLIESSPVRDYLRKLKAYQTSRGRCPSPGDTLFEEEATELFCVAPALLATVSLEPSPITLLTLLQSLATLSLDMHCWRRAGEVAGVLYDTVAITNDPAGEFLHIGLSPDRKISKTPGLYAGCAARPGDPTCPVANLKNYLTACQLYGLDLHHGPRLFPEIIANPHGEPCIRVARASHKRSCPHDHRTSPHSRRDDCHPHCEAWTYPALQVPVVNKWLHRLCELAEVTTNYNVHSLRSAPVLIMLANGTSITDINALMGWAPTSHIWKVYAKTIQFHSLQVPRHIDVAAIQAAIDSAGRSVPVLAPYRK